MRRLMMRLRLALLARLKVRLLRWVRQALALPLLQIMPPVPLLPLRPDASAASDSAWASALAELDRV